MSETLTDKQRARLDAFVEQFRLQPGRRVELPKDFDPAFKGGVADKHEGQDLLEFGVQLLSEYQARLAAQDRWGVLVVLQAMDTAGKDGTIRHVMSGVNPQGVSVHSFKVPSAEELDHDYLWRYAERLPAPRRDRHLQPLPLRGGPGRAGAPGEPRPPEAPGAGQAQGGLEPALPGDQRLGALPRPTTGSGS